MQLHLAIGNKTYSSWSLRPWLLLKQFGVPFTEVRLVLRAPDWSQQLASWSAAAKVPVLKDGELAIWDSLAIAEYLNETVLDGSGWPAAPAVRAVARSVVCEMHSGFAALRGELPMNVRREARQLATVSPAAQADIQRVLAIWTEALDKHSDDFLFGTFGIADAFFAPVVSRLRSYAIAIRSIRVGDYCERMLALPAMRQWYAEAAQEAEVLEDYDRR